MLRSPRRPGVRLRPRRDRRRQPKIGSSHLHGPVRHRSSGSSHARGRRPRRWRRRRRVDPCGAESISAIEVIAAAAVAFVDQNVALIEHIGRAGQAFGSVNAAGHDHRHARGAASLPMSSRPSRNRRRPRWQAARPSPPTSKTTHSCSVVHQAAGRCRRRSSEVEPFEACMTSGLLNRPRRKRSIGSMALCAGPVAAPSDRPESDRRCVLAPDHRGAGWRTKDRGFEATADPDDREAQALDVPTAWRVLRAWTSAVQPSWPRRRA